MEKQNILIKIKGPLCVSSEDGQRIYDKIINILNNGKIVHLSFKKVKLLTPTFLNSSIGPLYGEFSEDYINNNIFIQDINEKDTELLKRVTDNAKIYFKNLKNDRIWKGNINDENDEI